MSLINIYILGEPQIVILTANIFKRGANNDNDKLLNVNAGSEVQVLPLMSLSTFSREWAALHSTRDHRLMPLTPYILKASPVISASRLEYIIF